MALEIGDYVECETVYAPRKYYKGRIVGFSTTGLWQVHVFGERRFDVWPDYFYSLWPTHCLHKIKPTPELILSVLTADNQEPYA